MPNLAVIIPVYNGAAFIGKCLESCMAQPEIDEIIVIDDGSTDESYSIVKSYQEKDNRIRLLQHPGYVNLGRSFSRNLGIQSANSEWITFCDADDYFQPERFREFKETEKSRIDGLYQSVQSEYADQKYRSKIAEVTMIQPDGPVDHLQDYLISHREENISLIGMIIRRQLIMKVGLFNKDLRVGEDTDFIWRVTGHGKWYMIVTSIPKIVRRVHAGNTYTMGKDLVDSLAFYALWKERIHSLDISDTAKKRIEKSYLYYRYKKETDGRNLIRKCIFWFKFHWSTLFRK